MPLTYFYAEIFGFLYGALGLAMLINRNMMKQATHDLLEHRGTLMMTGFVTLFLGLVVVLTHNIWNAGVLAFVVTLIGWAMVVKGAAFLLVPPAGLRGLYRAEMIEKLWSLIGIIVFVVGAYLAYSGFIG